MAQGRVQCLDPLQRATKTKLLLQPLEFPFPEFLPLGVGIRPVLEIQVLGIFMIFEGHGLALLGIDLESTLITALGIVLKMRVA